MAPKKNQQKQQQKPQQQQQQPQHNKDGGFVDYEQIPKASVAHRDVVCAWFTGLLQTLPEAQQMVLARSTVVHLARALKVRGTSDYVAGAGSDEVCEVVAGILLFRSPHWHDTSSTGLETAAFAPGKGDQSVTLRQFLEAAAQMAKDAGWSWSASAARAEPSPAPVPPAQAGPRVTVISSPEDSTDSSVAPAAPATRNKKKSAAQGTVSCTPHRAKSVLNREASSAAGNKFLTLEDEERRAMVVTSRGAHGVYDWMSEEVRTATAALPSYCWPKKSSAFGRIAPVFLDVAAEFVTARADPLAFAKELPRRLKQHNKVLALDELAALQLVLATVAELVSMGSQPAGVPDTLVLAMAETATLISNSHEALRSLRLARCSRQALSEAEFEGWLSGKLIPGGGCVEAAQAKVFSGSGTKDADATPRKPTVGKCHKCGKLGWSKATGCTATPGCK